MPISTEDQILPTHQNPQTRQWQAHKRRTSSKFEPEANRKPSRLFLTKEKNGGGHDSPHLDALRSPTVHKPTLKGVGKSDCEVRIVSIAECESEVAYESLGDGSNGMSQDHNLCL